MDNTQKNLRKAPSENHWTSIHNNRQTEGIPSSDKSFYEALWGQSVFAGPTAFCAKFTWG